MYTLVWLLLLENFSTFLKIKSKNFFILWTEIMRRPSAIFTNVLVFERIEELLGKCLKFCAGENQFLPNAILKLQ